MKTFKMSEKKTLHLSDIIFGGMFVGAIGLLIYWIGERIGLVPIIGLADPTSRFNSYVFLDEINFTHAELIISLVLVVQITWILAWILWFGLIRKYRIQW